jgi:PAS domain S-box-containing protein
MITKSQSTNDIPDLEYSIENRFNLICSYAGIGDWYFDNLTGNWVWSDYLYDFYELPRHYSTSELLKSGLYSESDRIKLEQMVASAGSGKESEGSFKVTFPDGRVKWHYTYLKPVYDTSGKVSGTYGYLRDVTHKTLLEQEEKRLKSFYGSILENLPSQIAVFGTDCRYKYVNAGAIRDPEKRKLIIGKTNEEYFTATGRDPSVGSLRDVKIRECIESMKSVAFEESINFSGKNETYLRIFHPVFAEHGQIDYCIGYGIDITNLIHLQLVSDKQQLAIENATDGIALLSSQGKYIYMNSAHARLFDYENPEELIGQSWRAIYGPEEIERIETKLFPLVIQNGSWSGETLGMSKYGRPTYQEIALTALQDGGLICICRDTSARKEQQLKIQQLATVAEHTSSIVIITGPDRSIEWVNDSFTSKLGYTLDEVRGLDRDLILNGPETSIQTIKSILESTAYGKPYSGEILNYTKDKRKLWLYLELSPIFNDNGVLCNYVAVENDITLIKEAEEKLRASVDKERELNQFKSEFVHIASHQFRTPLASIRSSLDLLELKAMKGSFDDFKSIFSKHKASIANETDRMTELMNNILDLGRLDEGRIEFRAEPVGIFHFTKEFIQSEFSGSSSGQLVRFIPVHEFGVVSVDQILMKNVLRNIISNAIKYSQGKPIPEVDIRDAGDFFTIIVKDYGIGIPEIEQKYIFQSFFRASNARSIQGTGLGLLIARKMIETQGGNISLSSQVNNGTTIRINLPKATI